MTLVLAGSMIEPIGLNVSDSIHLYHFEEILSHNCKMSSRHFHNKIFLDDSDDVRKILLPRMGTIKWRIITRFSERCW